MNYLHDSLDNVDPHPLERGYHTQGKPNQLFVDGCVQIWPDTDFSALHKYSPSAYCVTTFMPDDDHGTALDAMANWHRIERHYPHVRIALSAKDIRDAHSNGDAAIVLAAQGGDFLGNRLERLDVFHAMGLRMMIPAYNNRSSICDGCLEDADAGLSRMGADWVEACNRLGVVIDLTHVGERSSFEIMESSKQPVVFSHSNPRGLVDTERNISDEQMQMCAQAGGVIAPTNYGPLNLAAGQTTRPTLNQFIDALEYVIQLVGIDHVAIGTDMSHGTYPDGDVTRGIGSSLFGAQYTSHIEKSPRSRLFFVDGFDDYGQVPQVCDALQDRGYSDEDVQKVVGNNFLRVFSEVWRH